MNLFRAFTTGAFLVLSAGTVANADSIALTVKDAKNRSVEHAVVALTPQFETDFKFAAPEAAEMQQRNTLFAPFVLPVQTGTKVSFPNLDEFRHHVYSFSKTKRFQLKLYGKDESKEILFDNPGVVALGCNIHDNMLAFVYVTEAPIYQKTKANGTVSFEGLPAGQYKMEVWHPDLKDRKSVFTRMVAIEGDTSEAVELALRSVRKKQNPPSEEEYN
ncbi:hypothetical protein [Kordiimonas laminariae]|uniref:hypothetical protein n=1 Tax=Kordiimonas laminariae TaxID=2917717 RepID=UPI001FF2C2F7|nr:hypothetical protein [Kordiimonas laminariae]MCK0070588.1 hypothetical protein [Kordiimonas laminariae]